MLSLSNLELWSLSESSWYVFIFLLMSGNLVCYYIHEIDKGKYQAFFLRHIDTNIHTLAAVVSIYVYVDMS